MKWTFDAETELLRLCSRTPVDEQNTQEICRTIDRGLDWDRFVRIGSGHGLVPLLYQRLAALKTTSVPRETLATLRAQADAMRLRSVVMTGKLLGMLRELQNAGIVAVPYKGPALAAFLYGDVGLRYYADLDLLVHPRDARNARNVLLKHGLVIEHGIRGDMPPIWTYLHYVTKLKDLGGKIEVELHWRLKPRFWPLSDLPAPAWTRLGKLALNGIDVPWLAPQDLLYVLCLHGSAHAWESLKWIVDVADLLRAEPGLDVARLMREVRPSGARRMIALGAFLAHDLMGTELRPDVLNAIRADPMVAVLVTDVYRNLLTEHRFRNDNLPILRFLAKATDRMDGKLHFLAMMPAYFLLHHIVRLRVAASRLFISG